MRHLYIENSVGKNLTEAFNKFTRYHEREAIVSHEIHPQMQQRQKNGDRWWIEDVTARGFVIVTCDLAIVDKEDERRCVHGWRAGRRLRQRELQPLQMMHALCRHWGSIERHLQQRPMVLKTWAGRKAPARLI